MENIKKRQEKMKNKKNTKYKQARNEKEKIENIKKRQ